MTDYPDFATPQAHATAISATGVPLLGAAATIISQRLQAIPAAGSATYGPVTVSQIGYAIDIAAQFPVAATNPFLEVELRWLEPVSATLYSSDHYFTPGSSGGPAFTVLGEGFSKSNEVIVIVKNLDPAQIATVSTFFAQDSVARTSDNWRWFNAQDNGLTVPGFTVAALPSDQDVLGVLQSVAIPASATGTWLFGMAPGKTVQVCGSIAGPPLASLQLYVTPVPSGIYTNTASLVRAVPPVAQFTYTFFAPRCPLALLLVNTSASTGLLQAIMNTLE